MTVLDSLTRDEFMGKLRSPLLISRLSSLHYKSHSIPSLLHHFACRSLRLHSLHLIQARLPSLHHQRLLEEYLPFVFFSVLQVDL